MGEEEADGRLGASFPLTGAAEGCERGCGAGAVFLLLYCDSIHEHNMFHNVLVTENHIRHLVGTVKTVREVQVEVMDVTS